MDPYIYIYDLYSLLWGVMDGWMDGWMDLDGRIYIVVGHPQKLHCSLLDG